MSNNIVFTDGFDAYTTVIDKWDVCKLLFPRSGGTGPVPSIAAGAGRGGAGALSIGVNTGGPYGDYVYAYAQKNTGTLSTMCVGFAFYWNPSSQTEDAAILCFMDQQAFQVSLYITPTGSFYFTRGGSGAVSGSGGSHGTVLGSSTTTAYPSNSFHFLEVQVAISSSAGVASLKVDQAYVLNQTGLNTQSTTNANFSSIWMGGMLQLGGSSYSGYMDDVYFDTLGFNGDNRVAGLLPTGNGSANVLANNTSAWPAATIMSVAQTILDSNGNLQRVVAITSDFKTGASAPTWATTTGVNTTDNHVTWTNVGSVLQYKLVNEPNPDDDYSYISTTTVGDTSRFTYPAISGPAIKTVVIWPRARKDDGGYRALQGSIKSGGTVYASGTDMPLGGNYQCIPIFLPNDPATAAAWTDAGVNAAEYGVKLTS